MKILVTGASGYIGRHTVRVLLDRGHTVLAADKTFTNENIKGLQQVNLPIFSGSKTIFADMGEPDVCLHLAWQNGFQHNSDTHIEDLAKHYIFARDMMRGGLTQFVGMGSMHEVGYWRGVVDEKTPTNPRSFYGIAKNAAREFSEVLATENNTIYQWIRAFYVTGDDKNGHSIFQKILVAEENRESFFPFTSGANKYDFIDVDDLAKQICAVVCQREVTGVINCCSGTPVSLADRVESFISDNSLKIRLKYNVYPDRPYDSPEVWGDNSKIEKILKGQVSRS